MTNTSKAAILGAVLLLAFAAGRFSAPERIHTESRSVETQTVVSAQKQTQAQTSVQDARHETVVTEVTRPDGTRETTTRTIDEQRDKQHARASAEDDHSTQLEQVREEKKDVVASSSKLSVSLLAGPRLSLASGLGSLVYGVHVSRPLLGPVALGVFAMSDGVAGVSLGLEF